MKIAKYVLIGLAVIILVIVIFLAYMGMFKSLKVIEKQVGPYIGAYESYVGDYKDTGKVFTKVENKLKKAGVTATRAIGIYHDNPSVVAKNKLRSDCGFILTGKNLSKVRILQKKGFKIITLKKSNSLIVGFPVRNNLSYMFGPMKAYPALMKYAKAKGYKMTGAYEIYDSKVIYFVMPIIK